jgi:hypothetical protein
VSPRQCWLESLASFLVLQVQPKRVAFCQEQFPQTEVRAGKLQALRSGSWQQTALACRSVAGFGGRQLRPDHKPESLKVRKSCGLKSAPHRVNSRAGSVGNTGGNINQVISWRGTAGADGPPARLGRSCRPGGTWSDLVVSAPNRT